MNIERGLRPSLVKVAISDGRNQNRPESLVLTAIESVLIVSAGIVGDL